MPLSHSLAHSAVVANEAGCDRKALGARNQLKLELLVHACMWSMHADPSYVLVNVL